MNYTATIAHHSIRSARVVEITAKTLSAAKAAATREFGGEQMDYIIELVAKDGQRNVGLWTRRVGGTKWVDWDRSASA